MRTHLHCALVLAAVACAASGQTTWYVNDDGPSDPRPGDCSGSGFETGRDWLTPFDSLEEAVNAASNGDRILVANGEYRGSCTMNFVIDKDLTIEATNACQAVFDGEGSRRAFTVDAGATVRVIGLRFVNCYKGFGGVSSGGAVLAIGGEVEFIDCCFESCGADDNGGAVYLLGAHGVFSGCHFDDCDAALDGGAIALDGGSLEVTGGSFSGCDAQRGGAVFGAGNVTLLSGISCVDNSAVVGGAFHVRGASALEIRGCEIGSPGAGNSASEDGGAVALIGCDAEMSSCDLVNNRADGRGGGAWLDGDGSLLMRDCYLYLNSAADAGGGVCNRGADLTIIADDGTSWFRECRANDPFASGRGGAIACVPDGDGVREVTGVVGTTFSDCASRYGGGAIYVEGPELRVDACEFRRNTSDEGRGGAMRLQEGAVAVVTDSRFEQNRAAAGDGGALASSDATRVSVTWCRFDDNHAMDGDGGAIYASQTRGSVTVSGGELTGNTASNAGGAVLADREGSLLIDGALFEHNEAEGLGGAICAVGSESTISGNIFRSNRTVTDGEGGAIYAHLGSLELRDSVLDGNAAGVGGGLSTRDAAVEVNASAFSGNNATLEGGGANHSADEGEVVGYERTVFDGNVSGGSGGGVVLVADAAFRACEFYGNSSAAGDGGAIWAWFPLMSNGYSLSVDGCAFANNSAWGSGGAIGSHLLADGTYVRNSSFTRNSAGFCGGVYVYDMALHNHNSAYWMNTDAGGDDYTAQVYAAPWAYDARHCAYADYVCPGEFGVVCLPGDPFSDGAANNLRLVGDTPCIDAGDNGLAPTDGAGSPVMTDLDGADRFVDDACRTDTGVPHTDPLYSHLPIVDIGAYEGPGCACAADFNGDGDVNTLDVLAFLNAWVAGDPSADINGDGLVDTRDVLEFLNMWNEGC